MKRLLVILGGVFLLLVLVGAGFFGYFVHQGRTLDASSRAYVEKNVPPILSTWSKDALLKRSSPALLKVADEHPERMDLLFKKLSALGPLQSFGDVKGDSSVFYTTGHGKVTTALYVADARFKNGNARISVRLVLSPTGRWQFLSFHVDSPLFLQ